MAIYLVTRWIEQYAHVAADSPEDAIMRCDGPQKWHRTMNQSAKDYQAVAHIRIEPCGDGVVVTDEHGFTWTAEQGVTAEQIRAGEVPPLVDTDPARAARIKAQWIAEHGESLTWDE